MAADRNNEIAKALSPQQAEHYARLCALSDSEMRDHLIGAPPSGASAYALYLLDRIIGYRSALDTVTTHVPEGERDTSKAAAAVANVTAASSRARVLVAIAREGDATNEEIAERTGLSGDTVRPRVGELRAGGYIERTGEKRLTTKGNEAELHRLTDDGWRKIRELQDAGDVHALRLVLTSDEPRLFAED